MSHENAGIEITAVHSCCINYKCYGQICVGNSPREFDVVIDQLQ